MDHNSLLLFHPGLCYCLDLFASVPLLVLSLKLAIRLLSSALIPPPSPAPNSLDIFIVLTCGSL